MVRRILLIRLLLFCLLVGAQYASQGKTINKVVNGIFQAFATDSNKGKNSPPSFSRQSLPAGVASVRKIEIPAGNDAYIWKNYIHDAHEYNLAFLHESYKRYKKKNPILDKTVKDFYDHVAILWSGDYENWQSLSKLLNEDIEKLLPLKCEDPFVLYSIGNVLYNSGKVKEARPYVQESMKILEKIPYPHIYRYYVFRRLRMIDIDLKKNPDQIQTLRDRMLFYLASGVGNTIVRKNPRIYFEVILFEWNKMTFDEKEEFYNQVQQDKHSEAWTKHMVAGLHHIKKGWKARGSGWASTVTQQGWRIFEKELKEAENNFAKAIELHPNFPEPYAQMINVSMAVSGDTPTYEWFNKAVRAQMDYNLSYSKFLWAIYPRWHGSFEAMLAFGEKCLNTKRYDTNVPYMYAKCVGAIMEDNLYSRRNAILKAPGVGDNLIRMYDNMIKHNPYWNKDKLRLEKAIFHVFLGQYKEAKPVIEMTDAKLFDTVMKLGLNTWMPCSKEILLTQIEAFTGPHANELSEAEKLFVENKPEKAIAKLKRLLPQLKEKKTHDYVRDWIGYCLMRRKSNGTRFKNSPPLHRAVNYSSFDSVDFLLENGVDVNQKNHKGETPLIILASTKSSHVDRQIEIAKRMLEKGADVNLQNNQDRTALQLAIYAGNKSLVDLLISNGANIQTPDSDGNTPLNWAVRNRRTEIVKQLLEKGANVNWTNKQCWSPLIYSTYCTPDLSITKQLLDAGANTEQINVAGWHPVHCAAYKNRKDIVELMLKHGAKPDSITKKGRRNIAHFAAFQKESDLLKLAISLGVNINHISQYGTPLHIATNTNRNDNVKILLKNGVELNAIHPEDEGTALHHACARGNVEVVKMLLYAGADTHMRNNQNQTPLDIANAQLKRQKNKRSEFQEIIGMLDDGSQ